MYNSESHFEPVVCCKIDRIILRQKSNVRDYHILTTAQTDPTAAIQIYELEIADLALSHLKYK